LGTIVLGSIFLGGQLYEYTNLFASNFTIHYQAFGSAFYTLTGFHGLHVTVGILFLLICLIRADRKSTRLNSSHQIISYAVFCLLLPPPLATLFPYTTLFRSSWHDCTGLHLPGRPAV